jgi:hypothetical protein
MDSAFGNAHAPADLGHRKPLIGGTNNIQYLYGSIKGGDKAARFAAARIIQFFFWFGNFF